MDELLVLISEVVEAICADCLDRSRAYRPDIFEPDLHEVVCGIIARQGTLAAELIKSPGIWNPHSAPLFHRSMADNHITLAYILSAEPERRAREFILYGLGQEKLAIAHLELHLQESDDPILREVVEVRRHWLESQRFELLTEVNVGSHTGISTRDMAEQSGNKELYDFNFTPFSAAVHSTWQHIGRYNLETCDNPLHGGHRIAVMPGFDPTFNEPWVALKSLHNTLLLADSFMGIQNMPVTSWERFQAARSFKREKKSSKSPPT